MKKKFLLFLVLVLIITSLSYFSFKKKKNVQYLTETVRRGNIEKTVKAAGDITASLLVDVGVQVTGQVKKLHVRLGQQVKKGDLIAEIDSTTQKNELQIAWPWMWPGKIMPEKNHFLPTIPHPKKNWKPRKNAWPLPVRS